MSNFTLVAKIVQSPVLLKSEKQLLLINHINCFKFTSDIYSLLLQALAGHKQLSISQVHFVIILLLYFFVPWM